MRRGKRQLVAVCDVIASGVEHVAGAQPAAPPPPCLAALQSRSKARGSSAGASFPAGVCAAPARAPYQHLGNQDTLTLARMSDKGGYSSVDATGVNAWSTRIRAGAGFQPTSCGVEPLNTFRCTCAAHTNTHLSRPPLSRKSALRDALGRRCCCDCTARVASFVPLVAVTSRLAVGEAAPLAALRGTAHTGWV